MKAIIPIFLALALAAQGTAGAADFFGVPEKTIVPKPAPATPAPATPAAATPAPTRGPVAPVAITGAPTDEEPPVLLPDGLFLKTPSVGAASDSGTAFHDIGPDHGVLIGLEYSTGPTPQGGTAIHSLTPLYLRAAGKTHGTLRGTLKPGSPATVLEARPGFAVAGIEARGTAGLEAFRITFMRYENGALDPAERYTTKWIGSDGAAPGTRLRTDTRPIVGIYGKAGALIGEFGLIVRREISAPPKVASTTFFGTPVAPDPGTVPMPPTDVPEESPTASPLEPTAFDPGILKTDSVGKSNGKGTAFRDLAPTGSLLIGFDYSVIKQNGAKIGSLRPLYLLGNGSKKLGDLHGENPTDARADARPGYAVGAIIARGDFMLRGFQLTFMRVKGAGLDPADSYQGEFIGGKVGETKNLDGAGQPIIGLYGKVGDRIEELGAFVKKGSAPLATTVRTPGTIPAPATPAPATQPPATAGIEVFAVADDSFTLFHNGREILSGSNLRNVESGTFPIVKGDVLTAIVKDKGGGGGEAWFSLRVVRDGKTVLDAGDMRYLTSETLNWKTNKLTTGFREPKVWTHEKQMGTDKRPRAAWAGTKDSGATVLYFKGLVP